MKELKELFNKLLDLKDKYVHLENDASFYLERQGNTLHIYFEDSNGATDWKNNFKFAAKSVVSVKKPYKNMSDKWKAHRGFLGVWKTIEPYLQPYICDLTVNKIVIGGYSHGAAIALLCYEYCKYNRPDISENIEGYGFGCPRVVWGFVGKSVKERFNGFLVIKNGKDLVTHVPPALFGYRHVGNILKIGRNKGYRPIESHYPDKYLIEL